MATVGKKQKATRAKSAPQERKRLQSSKYDVVVTYFSNIHRWLQTRPQAIRAWRKNDKKKKKYRSFRLQKKIKPEPRNMPSVKRLLKESIQFLWQHKRVFGAILLLYAICYVALLRSPFVTDMNEVLESVNIGLGSEEAQNSMIGTLATLGTVLSVSSESQANPTAMAIASLVMSLVYIWAIRELHTQKIIKARDAYYQGLTPLLSTVIIMIIASLQLLPFAVAAFIYSVARTTGVFVSGFEDLAVFSVALAIGLLSLYWVTSTIIALYIVTLPGMYPGQALRTAKKLVQFQRFQVFKKMFALPILFGLLYLSLLLLSIRIVPGYTFLIIEILPILALPFMHIYFYKLYRALI